MYILSRLEKLKVKNPLSTLCLVITSFKRLKYLGSVEVKKSLVLLSSTDRNTVVSLGIKKILQRYGRTNFFKKPPDAKVIVEDYVGRSPMSNWNDTHCTIEVCTNILRG